MSKKIDINLDIFYKHNQPREETKKRLLELSELGMEQTGYASFGIKDVMNGLYIEMVWEFSDEEFKDYIEWVKGLIKEKQKV